MINGYRLVPTGSCVVELIRAPAISTTHAKATAIRGEPRIHEGQEAVVYDILVCLWGDHFSEERVKI